MFVASYSRDEPSVSYRQNNLSLPQHNNRSPAGVALVAGSLVCDSLYANLEERFFFRVDKPVEPAEIMEVTSVMAAALMLAVVAATGELREGIEHSLQ
jgi:hypothetical protein